jgi:hypothetical protein
MKRKTYEIKYIDTRTIPSITITSVRGYNKAVASANVVPCSAFKRERPPHTFIPSYWDAEMKRAGINMTCEMITAKFEAEHPWMPIG